MSDNTVKQITQVTDQTGFTVKHIQLMLALPYEEVDNILGMLKLFQFLPFENKFLTNVQYCDNLAQVSLVLGTTFQVSKIWPMSLILKNNISQFFVWVILDI